MSRYTETYYGLENHDGQITANNGYSYLPKLLDMDSDEFGNLVFDIETWLEKDLNMGELDGLTKLLA